MTPAALPCQAPPPRASGARHRAAAGAAAARVTLQVESIGHRVPRSAFVGSVHSVFANACNLAVAQTLLTVCTSAAPRGPTTLRLASDEVGDLRDRFAVGVPIAARAGRIRSHGVELELANARLWRPAPLRPALARERIAVHLDRVGVRLGERPACQRSVLDGDAAPVATALADACRALDLEQATRHADRLVGWGEGLTPAGDDFLVGVLAGLAALDLDDRSRRRFRDALARAVAARSARTTPIAAHVLGLAADGDWSEPLLDLRDALVCAADDAGLDRALRAALAVGATSGADTVRGLVAAIGAWLPAPCAHEAA